MAARLLLLFFGCFSFVRGTHIVRPEDFGAVGDGKANDWVPIQKSVDSCVGYDDCRVLLTQSYLSGYILIKSDNVDFVITGTLAILPKTQYAKLPSYKSYDFLSSGNLPIKNVQVTGNGTIQSTSPIDWWGCKYLPNVDCWRPAFVSFTNVEGVRVNRLKFENSPNHNVKVYNCSNVRIDQIHIKAPSLSPNTDGVNFHGGSDQSLTNSIIENGDDCVSIIASGEFLPQCKVAPTSKECQGGNVVVRNVTCHHGHGLSIGGVRQGTIRNVTFENITATGGMSQGIYSTGGLRIKSYPNGSGSVSNIMYRNIVLDKVFLPIELQARYCVWPKKCPPDVTAIKFFNITFENIRGTSSQWHQVGLLACSKVSPCKNIVLKNVVLGGRHGDGKFDCTNTQNVQFLNGSNPKACSS